MLEALHTKTQLTSEFQEKLVTIAAWNLENVKERVAKEGAVQQSLLDASVQEYRKWMALIAMGNRSMGMISPEVDEVWHAHILFTRDYHAFCIAIKGDYIHHEPSTSSKPIGAESGERFKQAYKKHFGKLPKVWRHKKVAVLASCADACSDCSADCNACGADCGDEVTMSQQSHPAECSGCTADCSSDCTGDCSSCEGDCGDE